jgi:hypothetical protein
LLRQSERQNRQIRALSNWLNGNLAISGAVVAVSAKKTISTDWNRTIAFF